MAAGYLVQSHTMSRDSSAQRDTTGSVRSSIVGFMETRAETAVVVSGGLGAGKTTAATYMCDKHGFEHLSFVDRIWLPILAERGIEATRSSLQTLGIELVERIGINGLVDQLLEGRRTSKVVIDDARRPDVVEAIRARIPKVFHVHVEADFETRYPRLERRDGVTSRQEQAAAELVATETTIESMAPIADEVVVNRGSQADFERAIDEVLERHDVI